MKTIFATILVILLFSGQPMMAQFVQSSQPSTTGQDPASQTYSIKWVTTLIDMGEIPQNVPAKATFEFSNIISEPVFITSVRSSCGCTVPDYSKEPVLPKGSSTVTAIYNARNIGPYQKTVTVVTNDNMEHKLTLKGTVVADSSSQQK